MYPIVLIHGFPLDRSMWEEQAVYLRGRGYTVMTPNLPGFGGAASLSRERTSMEDFAAGIHELIVREAGGKAVVGGLSMGGYVLLALLREHPEAVAGAMLIDTRAEADTAEGAAGRLKSIEEMREHGPGKLIDGLMGKLVGKQAGAKVREELRVMMQRQSVEGIMRAQEAMAKRRDQTEVLAGLAMPVLIVVGAEDVITPPAVAVGMQGRVRGAMLVEVAGAGHMTPMERPEAVNAAMEGFLAAVSKA